MTNRPETTEPLRVALYIRVSTEEQIERYGIPLQREALLAMIKSRGKLIGGKDALILAGEGDEHIYIDEGISGTIPLDERPAFARLKENIVLAPEGSKPFDAVAVYKIDRFARKLKILLEVIDFFDIHGVQFISTNESIDTSTPFGRAILGIIGVIAELEIETTKLRTQAGREQAIKSGVVMGSAASYGFRKDTEGRYEIYEKEAETVRMIFKMLTVEKKSVYQISKYLTDNDYPSPEAAAVVNKKRAGEIRKRNPINFWRMERVRAILREERYTGLLYYNKTKDGKKMPISEWKLSPYTLPLVVDKFTFEQAQNLLNDQKHSRLKATDGHIYLLSGLLRCDSCYDHDRDTQGRMHWSGERKELEKGSGRFTYSYRCGRKSKGKSGILCNVLPLPANEVENYIVEQVKKLLANPIATYKHQLRLKSMKSEIKHLRIRREELAGLINSLPERRKRLQEQHTAGYIDIDQLGKDMKDLIEKESYYRIELKEIEYQISQNTLSQGYVESLEKFSEKYAKTLDKISTNREDVYQLLHELIEEIIVYSRPVEEGDVIAGKPKEGQKIPYRLHIKLKLPQDILRNMSTPDGGSSGQNSPSLEVCHDDMFL